MSDHWILRRKKPVRVDLLTWAKWVEKHSNKVVARTEKGTMLVSTVFLGLDHSFDTEDDGAAPILFETMVFHGDFNEEYCERYSTWDEAVAGHERICKEYLK